MIELFKGIKGIYIVKKIYVDYIIKEGVEEIVKYRFKVGKDDKYIFLLKI